jgi:OmpA-OmpF porin, OOP family
MDGRRVLGTAAVLIALATVARGQAPAPKPTLAFPPPAATPEAVPDTHDFPFLPALPGARLISTRRVAQPLELRPATADDEAVLAGMSYVQKTYERPAPLTPIVFIATLRDSLYGAGWKLIASTRVGEVETQPETINVAAHYSANGRILYARITQEPGGPYQVNVADVGDEDWIAALAKDCRLRPYTIQFDLDRATFRPEALPSLDKLAQTLKAPNAPAVEVQGHSDNIGPAGDAARQLLSEARAKAVAAWLVEHGVAKSKLTAKGYGKTKPLTDNDTDLGRAINRRIEGVRAGTCG